MVRKRVKSEPIKLGKEKKETKIMQDLNNYIEFMKMTGKIND